MEMFIYLHIKLSSNLVVNINVIMIKIMYVKLNVIMFITIHVVVCALFAYIYKKGNKHECHFLS